MNSKTTRLVTIVTGITALVSCAAFLPAKAQIRAGPGLPAPPGPCNRPSPPPVCEENPEHGWDRKEENNSQNRDRVDRNQQDNSNESSYSKDQIPGWDGEGRPPWQNRPY